MIGPKRQASGAFSSCFCIKNTIAREGYARYDRIIGILAWRKLMLSAYDPDKRSRLAWEVTKGDGPFTCPECKASVLLRKGEIKIHHFAHIPSTSCQYGV